MCIYGMEGPGGYQLFGRTIQVWNTWRTTSVFEPGHPWRLRFFDQIRFFQVSAEELLEARAAFPHDAHPLRIEPSEFFYAEYANGLLRDRDSIAGFKQVQQAAFDTERRHWKEQRIDEVRDDVVADAAAAAEDTPDGVAGVLSEVPGNVWKIPVAEGSDVAAGDVLAIDRIDEDGDRRAGAACGADRIHSHQAGADIAGRGCCCVDQGSLAPG